MNTSALTRPAAPRKLRVTLTAGRSAVAAARNEVRAAVRAWEVPVDPSVAVLLTGELVVNALRHGGSPFGQEASPFRQEDCRPGHETGSPGREASRAIELVVSCAYSQLQVDVYDTSPAVALQMDLPASEAAGQGLMLIAGLASTWGYSRAPTGKAGYFALVY